MPSSPAIDIHFPAEEAAAARAIARLDDFSPAAIHELGTDAAPVWRVFFATPLERDEAARAFAAEFSGQGFVCHAVDVPDEDWAARSQAGLRAVRVGRIVVAPPWDVPEAGAGLEAPGSWAGSTDTEPRSAADPEGDRPSTRGTGASSLEPDARDVRDITIVIQPSMGFGTGHHETTRLCLALLQKARVTGRDVLDVGTGSGVLAIAAALLGARRVRAIDVDDDALDSARVNVALNAGPLGHAAAPVELTTGNLRDRWPAADLVLANLTGGLLVSAADSLGRTVRPGGQLLVSGFQADEADAVLAALAPPGAPMIRRGEGGWEAALIDV